MLDDGHMSMQEVLCVNIAILHTFMDTAALSIQKRVKANQGLETKDRGMA